MLYALIMTISGHVFVVDTFASKTDCARALRQTHATAVYRDVRPAFRCERHS